MTAQRSRRVRAAERGASFPEVVAAVAVLSVAMTAALSAVERGATYQRTAAAQFLIEDRARGGLSGLGDVIAESSSAMVDTTLRVHLPGGVGDVFSDRFFVPGAAMRQCPSPTCAYHTRPDLTFRERPYLLGYEYCGAGYGAPKVRGAVLPGDCLECPVCEDATSSMAYLDAIKCFIPREVDGSFTSNADGSARWAGLVFFFPAPSRDGLCELRRYDVYASDLAAAGPVTVGGFNWFNPTTFSMADLFDLGTDGTTNGVKDGSVPNTLARSDATSEAFAAAMIGARPTLLVAKTLSTAVGGYPQATVDLRIDLETGETTFYAQYFQAAGTSWTVDAKFVRTPRVVASSVAEFAASTADSSPWDAVNNPVGVEDAGVVRFTMGTCRAQPEAPDRPTRHVQQFVVRVKN
ncbi:MAG TPA: hypothetical protein VEI02_16710 [Planctomycetota bacterium]|nr:hypothetical protein [Planctomycetota bacterium]